MKIVIIYASTKGKNTEEVANIIKKVTKGKVFVYYKVNMKEIMESDIVVFGSDVYDSRFNEGIIRFVKNIYYGKKKKVFIFSTTCAPTSFFINRATKHFKKILLKKEFNFIDSLNCYTFSYNTILNIFRKNKKITLSKKDIEKVEDFAKKIADYE